MAITGKFQADFTSFSTAVEKAQVELRGFEGNANKVETALSRMTDQFSGRKVIQDATLMAQAIENVGGVTKLTATELQKVGAQAQAAGDQFRKWGQEVPSNIQAIADASKNAASSWKGFVDGFDVKGAVADPLGTAVKGMEALASSIGPVGVIASGVVTGLVAMGAALFDLTAQAAKVGGTLNDMSQKTGVSVPVLSRLSQAAQVAGSDIDTLSNAIYKMDVQAADSPDKFAEGLKRLGLNTKEFLALAPEQRLFTFANALTETADASERNAAGAEIMGKQFKDLGPTLMKLNEAMHETSGISVWSEQQAADAEQFEMQVKALKLAMADLGTSIGRDLIPPALTLLQWARDLKPILAEWASNSAPGRLFHVLGDEATYAAAALSLVRDNFGKLPGVIGDTGHVLTEAERRMQAFWQSGTQSNGLTLSVQDLEFAWKEETKANNDAVDAVRKAQEAAKKHAEEMKKQAEAAARVTEEVHKLEFGFYGLSSAAEAIGRVSGSVLSDFDRDLMKSVDAAKKVENGVYGIGTAIIEMGKVAKPAMSDLADGMLVKLSGRLGQIGSVLNGVQGEWADFAKIGINALEGVASALAKGDVFGAIVAGATAAVAVVAKLWNKLRDLFGGPSADEQAAREEFAKSFDSANDAIAQLAPKLEAAGAGSEETRLLIKALFDATHVSAKAVDDAMQAINDRIAGTNAAVQATTDSFNKLGQAINGLPSGPTSSYEPIGPEQSFAGGGTVRPFASGRSSGLVRAHVGEMVLTPQQQANLLRGGGGTTTHVTYIQLDGRVIAENTTTYQNQQDRLSRKVRAA